MRTLLRLEDLVIPNGAQLSNAIKGLENAQAVWIYAPATLTGTVSIQVEPTETGAAFVTLTSGGSNVTIAAGTCLSLSPIAAQQLRVSSNGAEAATRTFRVLKRLPA